MKLIQAVKKAIKHADENTLYYQYVSGHFGDTLHSTIIINHYAINYNVIWVMPKKYMEAHKDFPYATMIGVSSYEDCYEQTYYNYINALELICKKSILMDSITIDPNSMANNFFRHAGIIKLKVPRKPIFFIKDEDLEWADKFIKKHNLNRFIVLEYNSYSICGTWTPKLYNELINHLNIDVVYTGANSDPDLYRGIDARGISWGQAAALIKKATAIVGCGSGLTMLAASQGISTIIIELNVPKMCSMLGCGYAESILLKSNDPQKVAKRINEITTDKFIKTRLSKRHKRV